MTMPSDEEVRAMFPTPPNFGKRVLMIDREIAEELARALEAVDAAINATYFGPDAERNKRKAVKGAVRTGRKALARFRAINP